MGRKFRRDKVWDDVSLNFLPRSFYFEIQSLRKKFPFLKIWVEPEGDDEITSFIHLTFKCKGCEKEGSSPEGISHLENCIYQKSLDSKKE